jgi:prolyl oligopeptidase
MRKLRPVFTLALLLAFTTAAVAQMSSGSPSAAKLTYPETRKIEHVDDYHGTKVADPYRWLEDDNAPDTKAWVEAQNKVTFGYLGQIPVRAAIKDRLTQLWNFERFGVPDKEGGKYFYWRNAGLQNQNVWYVMDSLSAEPKVLIDPNTLSKDGTVAVTDMDVTRDAKLLVYGVAASGSDWKEYRVRDIATGQDLPDVVKWVKFSAVSWTADGKGFFYSRYAEHDEKTKMQAMNEFQKLYFHKLGTPQSDDQLIFEDPKEKQHGFIGTVSEDGKYLIINVWKGSDERNRVYVKDLTARDSKVIKLLDDYDAAYNYVDNIGTVFYFRTDLDAPRYRVIAIDLRKPQRADWKTVIAQSAETIDDVDIINDMFVVEYLKDARAQVKVLDLKGKPVREVELPGIGNVQGFDGRRNETETFYSFVSFTRPSTVYRYDLKTGKSTVFRQPKVAFNPDDYETKQVFYNSKDGTRVPMFITHKKGIRLDGNNPTYLYAYGGFNVSMTPSFSVANLVWMEMGGVYAMANLRGGGEYGKEWHEAGMKLKKQNVFDDFIAAAEWLIANKYTSTPKLAIGGGSNGGLLVGAVMTQRPDLFGATLPGVGVMDMLRFHKFTIGWGWVSDYGSSDDAQQFKALYAYSPLHNLKPGVKYPPTLVTTADHDDRVVPAHSFKFAARLQEVQAGDAPVLIRIETKAGHGAGKPTSKQIEEVADKWGFLVHNLNVDVKGPVAEMMKAKATTAATN